MNEPTKQPWGVAVTLLAASVAGWLTVLAGIYEATSAPQNLILAASKIGTVGSALWIVFLIVPKFRLKGVLRRARRKAGLPPDADKRSDPAGKDENDDPTGH